MLYLALAFFLGDVCLQCLPALPIKHDVYVYWLPTLAMVLLLCFSLRRHKLLRYCVAAFCVGFYWAAAYGLWQLGQDLDPSVEGRDVTVVGYIDSIPEREPYGLRFSFVIETAVEQLHLPHRVELSWYSRSQALHAAERWQLQVRLKRRHSFANPGGMDYEAQVFRQGIGGSGYVREVPANRKLGIKADEYVLRTRAALAERIANATPQAPMQGVIRGLAVGDQQAISTEQWQVFARTGISHLIAISGSHIGMVAVLAAYLGGWLAHCPRAQSWRLTRTDLRAYFGFSAALIYSLLAGMSVPTQRTLAMLTVYFATLWLRRAVNTWHSFGLALLACVVIDPFAPLAIGSWLSFGAVAALLLNQHGRLQRDIWWREFFSLQLVASIGLLPLLIAAFGNVSIIAPLVNLIAIPLFTIVLVPAVLLSCAALLIYAPLGVYCLQWVSAVLDKTYLALEWAAHLPLATWYLPQLPTWVLLFLALGALIAVLPLYLPMRLSGLMCCLPALLWRAPSVPIDSFELTALDVGQGLSVVIRTHSHVLLYDAGPKFQSGNDTGLLVVLPYLHAMGVRRLNMMMISHGDDDHAGGMNSVSEGMPIQALLFGPSVKHSLPGATRCERGQRWRWDGVDFEVLHPDTEYSNVSDNNTSCVLRIAARGGSALLLGDAEKAVEQQLVANQRIPPTDIVVAGHHGSRSSSTNELVQASQAREVLFSAGYRNRWGFPKPEIVQRWRDAGAHTDSTIDSGAISLLVLPTGVSAPRDYRATHRHYWSAE